MRTEGSLTYQRLVSRADEVARRLLALGVGPQDLVGLCLPRSAALIVGALGVLKAGGVYVALDPAYPETRLRHIIADSGSEVLLTDRHGARTFDRDAKIVALGDGGRSTRHAQAA
jgi:non-ribosomal peptide synthetase component F